MYLNSQKNYLSNFRWCFFFCTCSRKTTQLWKVCLHNTWSIFSRMSLSISIAIFSRMAFEKILLLIFSKVTFSILLSKRVMWLWFLILPLIKHQNYSEHRSSLRFNKKSTIIGWSIIRVYCLRNLTRNGHPYMTPINKLFHFKASRSFLFVWRYFPCASLKEFCLTSK